MAATSIDSGVADGGPPNDIVDYLAGIDQASSLAHLRAQRPEVARYAQRCALALLEPDDPGGLSRLQRELIGLRVAILTRLPPLVDWHRTRLTRLGSNHQVQAAIEDSPKGPAPEPALAALLQFVDRLTHDPNAATPDDLVALKAVGFSPGSIVTMAQLIGFLAFQVRLLSGLRLLGEAPAAGERGGWEGRAPGDRPRHTFTLDELGWRPWLETVDQTGATPEQAAMVVEATPRPSARPYYALLAHDVPVLRERTGLMRAVMYAPGGLRRADRELGAVAASRFNGCAYCASVHARLFIQLSKEQSTVQRLLTEGLAAHLGDRERAVVDYAVALTRDPAGMVAADLVALRRAGLTDLEILDLTQAVAMFAWANRLLQTLGEPEPVADSTLSEA